MQNIPQGYLSEQEVADFLNKKSPLCDAKPQEEKELRAPS